MSKESGESKRSPSIPTLQQFNELLRGWNCVEPSCFQSLLELRDRLWDKTDIQFIQQMITDGCSHALYQLFQGSIAEPLFLSLRGGRIPESPPQSLQDFQKKFLQQKFLSLVAKGTPQIDMKEKSRKKRSIVTRIYGQSDLPNSSQYVQEMKRWSEDPVFGLSNDRVYIIRPASEQEQKSSLNIPVEIIEFFNHKRDRIIARGQMVLLGRLSWKPFKRSATTICRWEWGHRMPSWGESVESLGKLYVNRRDQFPTWMQSFMEMPEIRGEWRFLDLLTVAIVKPAGLVYSLSCDMSPNPREVYYVGFVSFRKVDEAAPSEFAKDGAAIAHAISSRAKGSALPKSMSIHSITTKTRNEYDDESDLDLRLSNSRTSTEELRWQHWQNCILTNGRAKHSSIVQLMDLLLPALSELPPLLQLLIESYVGFWAETEVDGGGVVSRTVDRKIVFDRHSTPEEKRKVVLRLMEARKGDFTAQYDVAQWYRSGTILEKSLEAYQEWLQRALENPILCSETTAVSSKALQKHTESAGVSATVDESKRSKKTPVRSEHKNVSVEDDPVIRAMQTTREQEVENKRCEYEERFTIPIVGQCPERPCRGRPLSFKVRGNESRVKFCCDANPPCSVWYHFTCWRECSKRHLLLHPTLANLSCGTPECKGIISSATSFTDDGKDHHVLFGSAVVNNRPSNMPINNVAPKPEERAPQLPPESSASLPTTWVPKPTATGPKKKRSSKNKKAEKRRAPADETKTKSSTTVPFQPKAVDSSRLIPQSSTPKIMLDPLKSSTLDPLDGEPETHCQKLFVVQPKQEPVMPVSTPVGKIERPVKPKYKVSLSEFLAARAGSISPVSASLTSLSAPNKAVPLPSLHTTTTSFVVPHDPNTTTDGVSVGVLLPPQNFSSPTPSHDRPVQIDNKWTAKTKPSPSKPFPASVEAKPALTCNHDSMEGIIQPKPTQTEKEIQTANAILKEIQDKLGKQFSPEYLASLCQMAASAGQIQIEGAQ